MSGFVAGDPALRAKVEDFLFYENDLLDRWELDSWYALFAPNGMYHIVTPGLPDADTANPDVTLFLVSDDMERLNQRIDRLGKKTAHVEYPRSQTSHLVSNIRVERREDGVIVARTRFATYRTKHDNTVSFVGHQIYQLEEKGEGFAIRDKRTMLDFDTLGSQGKVTILL